MKTKKMRKGAIALLGAVAALCVGAAGAGFAGGIDAFAMNTASSTEIISGDLWDSTAKGISTAPLKSLVSKITGGDTGYSDLLTAVKTSSDGAISASEIRTANSNKDLVVTLNGKNWTVTYVSQDMSGNVIATLWYAETEEQGTFSSGWVSSNNIADQLPADYTNYSNHYGGSYMRAVRLGNGGYYWDSKTANATNVKSNDDLVKVSTVTNATAKAAMQASAFYDLAQGDISRYLVAPNLVEWQYEQFDSLLGATRFCNDSLIDVSDNWHDDNGKNAQSDELYYQWGGDKVWLTSRVETGTNSVAGLWGISANQRESGSPNHYSWQRSGTGSTANNVSLVGSTSSNNGANIAMHGIRPAVHLNLTKAYSKQEESAGDIYNEKLSAFDRTSLNAFYAKLGATDYATLANKVSGGATYTSAQLADLNSHQGDVSVKFGGYNWTVTYLSTTKTGDVIATLWYDDEESGSLFTNNGWYNQNDDEAYGTTHSKFAATYGASWLRTSGLNNSGTYYASSAAGAKTSAQVDALTMGTYTQSASHKFAKFTMSSVAGSVVSYLATPSQVGWQEDEGVNQNTSQRLPNESYGVIPATAENEWHTRYLNSDFQSRPEYSVWGNDTIWIPSLTETGSSLYAGIWRTSAAQRESNYSTGYSWLRSAHPGSASGAYALDSVGSVSTDRAVGSLVGVRPAIHLNLTAAETNVKGSYFAETNKTLQDSWNAAVEESLFGGGKQVTFTLTDNWYALADDEHTTSFGTGAGFSNGIIFVPAGANIVIELNGYRLDRNLSVEYDHGNVIENAGKLTINDNSAYKTGILTGAYSDLDIGGAINNYGELTINGGNFTENISVPGGGAAVMSRSRVVVNGGVFEHNEAISGSGGAFVVVGSAEFNGGIIRNNIASGVGGGIYVHTYSELLINYVEIYNNVAAKNSGGLNIGTYSKLVMNGGKINDNYSTSSGGGIAVWQYTTTVLNGGEISGNVATTAGGAVYATTATAYLNDCLIVNNTANGSNGAAVYLMGTSMSINGGKISDNTSVGNGGGLTVAGSSTVDMYGGEISGNTCTSGWGGGVYLNTSTMNMYGGVIKNNSATSSSGGDGGGVYVNANSTFNMRGGLITENTANVNGGGVFVREGTSRNGEFNLWGGTISSNIKTSGTANDVYLSGSTIITVKGACGTAKDKTLVGIANTSGVFTRGYTSSGNNTTLGNAYFFANNGKQIVASGNELAVGTANATKSNLSWRYTHDGATVTIDTKEIYTKVAYTGKPYTVSLATSGASISTIVDENSRPVTAMTNAGKYYITATNMASYNNPVITLEVLPASIADATVTVAGGSVYDGKAHTPEVKVELGGVTLTQDKDYTLAYSNNINAGTANVTVTGKGNYKGIALGSFEIEKHNLEVRWNNLEAVYDGTTKAALAFAEGVLDGESVTLTLAYQLNGHRITPLNAGTYTVYALLGANSNYKLASGAQATQTFIINPATVEAVWGTLSFTYNGKEQTPRATYKDIAGNTISLAVTVSGAHVAADEYTAIATTDNSNYAVSAATANMRYTIAQKAVTPTVGADGKDYDGTAFVPSITVKDLSGADLTLTYEYFDADGNSLGSTAPVNVGSYVARVTLADSNYALDGGYYDFAYAINATAAAGSWTFADTAYSGNGKAPEFAYDDSSETLGFTVTYGKDKGDGTAEEYTADKPVAAGDYVAKVEFDNGNYNEILHAFTITKKSVTVSWTGDELSVIGTGNSFKWTFDGTPHAPTATATADGTDLELSVSGQTNAGSYTATAQLKDTEVNKNYTLTGNTQAYSIAQSTITAVKWYEYGSSTPVADGAKLSYQYISVYGWDGPKLSAYGVAKMQGQGAGGSTVTVTVEVPLAVTYQGNTNTSGYWSVDTYTAVASIKTADRASNCTTSLTAADLSIDFAVTEKKLETSVATIVWAYDTDAVEDAVGGVWYWIYDNKLHAPEARRVLPDATYDADDPDTYEVLPVGGKKTNTGRYYAYILPSCGYDIDEDDADCLFEIRAREITVAWTGVGGAGNNFEWTYDGLPHAPAVRVVSGASGLTVTLEAITEYTDAGSYVAVAKTNANFVIKEDTASSAERSFTIKQLVLDPDDIVWKGKGGSTTDFTWTYDGSAYAPTATLEVQINGTPVTVALKITGEASTVGEHTAYAMLDSAVAANANFVLKGASCDFKIENGAVAKIEWEGAESGEELEFVYDGNVHTPKAYYWLDGDKVYLNVIGGAADAGEYIAYVTDNTGVTAGMSHAFTVKPAELTVSWTQTTAEYDKAAHSPEAAFADAKGNAVALTLGRDYAVTSFVTAGTYTAEITFLNKNYTFAGTTGSVEFTVTPKKIFVSWTAQDDGTFNYEYNGQAQKPEFTLTESGVTVTVTGAETAVGSYVAVATVSDNNYCVYDALHTDKAEREYSIVPFAITVIWKGEDGSETDFDWEYDGVYFVPTATYTDWEGNEKTLTVRGERMDAGNYTATAVLPQNCSFKYSAGGNAGTHSFVISPKLITGVVWEGENGSATDFEWVYTGSVITPVAKTSDGDILSVAGGATDAGEYTASAVLPNAQNYKFDDGVGGTQKFKITEKTVDVLWYGKDDSATDFVWDYTGSIIRPTAKFADVDGNYIDVPVNGGASSEGQHTATAADVFANYVFSDISLTQVFEIKAKKLTVTWNDAANLQSGVYVYEYNGKAQMPLATAAESINLIYTVKNSDGDTVGAVIGAGEYTVTVAPADKNYVIDAADATVNVKITPKTVAVQWQKNLALLYTGSELVPEAWFIDADNQAVALKVTGAQTDEGTDYEATADFMTPNDNYVLDTTTVTEKFDVVKNTDDKVWDWEAGEWKTPEAPADPGDGGDTAT